MPTSFLLALVVGVFINRPDGISLHERNKFVLQIVQAHGIANYATGSDV